VIEREYVELFATIEKGGHVSIFHGREKAAYCAKSGCKVFKLWNVVEIDKFETLMGPEIEMFDGLIKEAKKATKE
jgi:hypothetical protein